MKSLFQTVQDRENPTEIESMGPFLCKRKNAWLGEGFYFWDSFIDLAHWWGKFVVLKNALQSKLQRTDISVNDILSFLKRNSEFSKTYKAIRAKATGCMRNAPSMKFVSYNKACLELMPPVQICVLDTTFLYKKIYEIVYPVHYVSVKD